MLPPNACFTVVPVFDCAVPETPALPKVMFSGGMNRPCVAITERYCPEMGGKFFLQHSTPSPSGKAELQNDIH